MLLIRMFLFSVLELPADHYSIFEASLVQGLCAGVKLDVYFPGFPTFKHLPHSAHFEKRGVRVFQSASREENLILTITQQQDQAKVSATPL